MTGLLSLLTNLLPLLAKAAPVLLAAEQALATAGIPAFIAYLESLIGLPTPPAGLTTSDMSSISSLTHSLKSCHATCCASAPAKP